MMLKKFIEIISIILLVLNTVGAVVGGIWLLFLGEWKLMILGIVYIAFSGGLNILLMPNLFISVIAMNFYEKKSFLRYIFGFISVFYTNVLMLVTCYFAFSICTRYYMGDTLYALADVGINYIPYILWAWVLGLAPWQNLASQENNNHSVISVFILSIFYLLFLTSIFIIPSFSFILVSIICIAQLLILPVYNLYIIEKHS